MIRLSKMTDYGIVVLTELARAGATRTARELAEATAVPLPSVSKVLKVLSQADLLASQRGVAGGYSLAAPAETIPISRVIAALEGPISLTECGDHGPARCDLESVCQVSFHWKVINRAIYSTLEQLTLADMCGPGNGVSERVEGLNVMSYIQSGKVSRGPSTGAETEQAAVAGREEASR